jgi:hypothetical protein
LVETGEGCPTGVSPRSHAGDCGLYLAIKRSHAGATPDGLLTGEAVHLTLDSLAGHAEASNSWHLLEINSLEAGHEVRAGSRSP